MTVGAQVPDDRPHGGESDEYADGDSAGDSQMTVGVSAASSAGDSQSSVLDSSVLEWLRGDSAAWGDSCWTESGRHDMS